MHDYLFEVESFPEAEQDMLYVFMLKRLPLLLNPNWVASWVILERVRIFLWNFFIARDRN